jgi:hypothetical protein
MSVTASDIRAENYWCGEFSTQDDRIWARLQHAPEHRPLCRRPSALAADRAVAAIDFTAGARDLLITLIAENAFDASQYVLRRLSQLPTISKVRTHFITEALSGGGDWRLRSLSPDELQRIPRARPPRTRAARHVPRDLARVIYSELALDGRASSSSIAQRADVSNQRVVDAISTLRHNGTLMLRTDIARAYSGWPVYTWYFMQVPAT